MMADMAVGVDRPLHPYALADGQNRGRADVRGQPFARKGNDL